MVSIDTLLEELTVTHIVIIVLGYLVINAWRHKLDLQYGEASKSAVPMPQHIETVKSVLDVFSRSIGVVVNELLSRFGLGSSTGASASMMEEIENIIDPDNAPDPKQPRQPQIPSSGVIEEMVLSTQSELFIKLESVISGLDGLIDRLENLEENGFAPHEERLQALEEAARFTPVVSVSSTLTQEDEEISDKDKVSASSQTQEEAEAERDKHEISMI